VLKYTTNIQYKSTQHRSSESITNVSTTVHRYSYCYTTPRSHDLNSRVFDSSGRCSSTVQSCSTAQLLQTSDDVDPARCRARVTYVPPRLQHSADNVSTNKSSSNVDNFFQITTIQIHTARHKHGTPLLVPKCHEPELECTVS